MRLLDKLETVIVQAQRSSVVKWWFLVLSEQTMLYLIKIKLIMAYLIEEWFSFFGWSVLLQWTKYAETGLFLLILLILLIFWHHSQEIMNIHALIQIKEEGNCLFIWKRWDVNELEFGAGLQVISVFARLKCLVNIDRTLVLLIGVVRRWLTIFIILNYGLLV